MGLDSPIRLTKVDKDRNKEDQVGMQIANPNLVIQTDLGGTDGQEPQNPT
jgi:hypothetical protein